MKIALMTWYEYNNYGSSLQAVAMVELLRRMKHDVFLVDYPSPRYFLKVDETWIDVLKSGKSKLIKSLHKHYVGRGREEAFESFHKQYLTFTTKCETQAELEALNDEYDCFICGSDYIWGTDEFRPHYFLDFVHDPNKMIAYAPSSCDEIKDNELRKKYVQLTSRFLHISTREQVSSDRLSSWIKRDVKTVLDPTFLIDKDFWDSISTLSNYQKTYNKEKKYALVYLLGTNKNSKRIVRKLSSLLGLEIKQIPVFFGEEKNKWSVGVDVSPEDFICLIQNASFVFTDSFHAVVFSIIYSKQFVVFERFNKGKLNENHRIYNILSKVGLQNRIYSFRHTNSLLYDEIDYDSVKKKIEIEIIESKKYLENSIAEVNEYISNGIKKKKINCCTKQSLCCGCGACKIACPSEAIDIIKDEYGFYKSKINYEKCLSCGKCVHVCPFVNFDYSRSIDNSTVLSYTDCEKKALLSSSSGGFSYRTACIYNANGHEIIGCTYNKGAQAAEHRVIDPNNVKEIQNIQGSKYIQSYYVNALQKAYESKRAKVFFGTPCQIAAARNLLSEKMDVLYIDLTCHGVPSNDLFQKYLRCLNERTKLSTKEADVIFRYKPRGWRKKYIYIFDGKRVFLENENTNPFFKLFNASLCYSEACYECPWRKKSAADIRIGDYWGKQSINGDGISQVIIITGKGEEIIRKFRENGLADCFSGGDISDYFSYQQVFNYPKPVFWEKMMCDFLSSEDSFTILSHKYTDSITIKKFIKAQVKRIKDKK